MENQGNDLVLLRETLEEEELKSANGIAPILSYKKLLLIYLIESDLANAKFLWKRIPAELAGNNELIAIWNIGQCLWKREFSNIYSIVSNVEWSGDVKGLIELFCDTLRKRLSKLIAESYSVIKIEELCKFMGVNEEQLVDLAASYSWTVDMESRLVRITQNDGKVKGNIGTNTENTSAELLHRLTHYVSFLEN